MECKQNKIFSVALQVIALALLVVYSVSKPEGYRSQLDLHVDKSDYHINYFADLENKKDSNAVYIFSSKIYK